MPTKVDKTCWIYKWQTQHQKVLCIQTSTFVIHAASLYYLTHITNVWGCMEILPIHCGAGQDKTRQDNALFGVLYSPMYIDFIQII